MRFLYSTLLYCLAPVIVLRLLWRSRKSPAYRQRLRERFAYGCMPVDRPVIWVHSVSVGETLAAVPLVQSLQQQYPQHIVLITTMTPTGSEQVRQQFADSVLHVYAPYDLPGAVGRFLRCFRPEIAIIMETEIWPNLFHTCRQRGLPVILANARLSEKSARGYSRFSTLMQATLRCIDTIACQTQADAERFSQLGASERQLRVSGSIKFDLQLPAGLLQRAASLRSELSQQRPVWIAASTHEGEDELILEAYKQLLEVSDDLFLILVPRHPERFEQVARLCEKNKLTVVRRSSGQACDKQTQVYLGDTMGELLLLYALADVAFVGGSLVPVGGHNLLEPAALGIATVSGPYMHNFSEITRRLLDCGGLVQIEEASQLTARVGGLLADMDVRQQMGANAQAFVEANRGALQQLQLLIDETLMTKALDKGIHE